MFELLDGVRSFADKTGVNTELTLIGSEDFEFSQFIEDFSVSNNLKVSRVGKLAHKDVLVHMSKNDVYCYPSQHLGEGHNNSINEAMMFGLAILTTKVGFLPEVLGDSGFFIDEVDSSHIFLALLQIQLDKFAAREKARRGHQRLLSNYTDSVVYERLELFYKNLVI